MGKLIADFGLKDFQAAGILGNIGEECDGFREMQEKKPIIPGSKGGLGWAQWTGPRRTLFELFCTNAGLSPFEDAANYGFLKEELNTSQSAALTAVQKTPNISKAVRQFEGTFEHAKSGLEHFDRGDQWADLAIQSFRANMSGMVPPAIAKILDPDLVFRVVGQANLGTSAFYVIDQFTRTAARSWSSRMAIRLRSFWSAIPRSSRSSPASFRPLSPRSFLQPSMRPQGKPGQFRCRLRRPTPRSAPEFLQPPNKPMNRW